MARAVLDCRQQQHQQRLCWGGRRRTISLNLLILKELLGHDTLASLRHCSLRKRPCHFKCGPGKAAAGTKPLTPFWVIKEGAKGGPGTSNIWNNQNKCVFNKCIFKVCESCTWQCPGTFTPSSAHIIVSLYLYSYGSNVWSELRALEGRRFSSKKPFKGPRRRRGSCWTELRIIVFPHHAPMICPLDKSMKFSTYLPP